MVPCGIHVGFRLYTFSHKQHLLPIPKGDRHTYAYCQVWPQREFYHLLQDLVPLAAPAGEMGMGAATRAVLLALTGLLAGVSPAAAQASCPAGPNVAGIVAGCILGTLAVVGLVIAIVLLIRYKKNQPKKAKGMYHCMTNQFKLL